MTTTQVTTTGEILTPPRICCYCGCKEEEKTVQSPYSRRSSWKESNFGNCSAKGLACCNACWDLKYPHSRIPSTSISAAGITHEHALMSRGKSMADSPQLKIKWPKLSELATA